MGYGGRMSNRVLERIVEGNSQSELTGVLDISEEELKEFIAALLVETKNLANIAGLTEVENLLRLAIDDLSADEEHPAPDLRRGIPRPPLI